MLPILEGKNISFAAAQCERAFNCGKEQRDDILIWMNVTAIDCCRIWDSPCFCYVNVIIIKVGKVKSNKRSNVTGGWLITNILILISLMWYSISWKPKFYWLFSSLHLHTVKLVSKINLRGNMSFEWRIYWGVPGMRTLAPNIFIFLVFLNKNGQIFAWRSKL